jgi:hypothetical protein
LKAFDSDNIHSIISLGQWLYCFECKTDQEGNILSAPLRIVNKQTEEQQFEDSCIVIGNHEYYKGATLEGYFWTIEMDSFKRFSAKIEKTWVGRHPLCSDQALSVYLLRQLSKGSMTIDMLQAIIDAICWE